MPCRFIRFPDGAAIICGPKTRVKPCWACPRPGLFLCDGPSPTGKGDCDRPLCTHHRTQAGAGVDYCYEHAGSPRLL